VFGLVARGLTNKEIAGSLGITERGVAAQVSRLLAKFTVPNRAGLIAKVMSGALGARSVSGDVDPLVLTSAMQRECEAYDRSTFMVALTLGSDSLIVYVNDACRQLMGVDVESPGSATFRARRSENRAAAFVDGARAAFASGLPVSIESQPARWRRDNGTQGTGTLSCVVQPVHRAAAVIGVLWICSRESDRLSP
jgi:hypothetical protein